MVASPLAESNYYVVFTKVNSPSDPYASKTKLRSLSGTLSSCVDQSFSKTSFCPLKLFAPEPLSAYSIAKRAAPRLAIEHKVLQAQAAPHLFHLFGVAFECP